MELFRFVGRVLGKALREGLTVQPRFSRSFLSFLTGDFNYVTLLEDLRSLDPELHKNLRFLQLYDGDAADRIRFYCPTSASARRSPRIWI